MDQNPGRQAQMMARWTAAGSLGNLIGPLLLAGGFALGWGWRWAFAGLAGLALVLVTGTLLARFPGEQAPRTREKLPARHPKSAKLRKAQPPQTLKHRLSRSNLCG